MRSRQLYAAQESKQQVLARAARNGALKDGETASSITTGVFHRPWAGDRQPCKRDSGSPRKAALQQDFRQTAATGWRNSVAVNTASRGY